MLEIYFYQVFTNETLLITISIIFTVPINILYYIILLHSLEFHSFESVFMCFAFVTFTFIMIVEKNLSSGYPFYVPWNKSR